MAEPMEIDEDLDETQDETQDETLGGFIVKDASDSDSEVSAEDVPDDDDAVQELLREEAAKVTANLQATVVNGRSLRDRSKITAPKDAYWERFGKKTSEKLAVVENKREMLDDIKAWKKEFSGVNESFVWPSVSMKSSTEAVEEAHRLVIETFELELADDDEDSEDMDCDESDEEDSDDDDDEDSDDDEDEDDDDDDDDDEDMDDD